MRFELIEPKEILDFENEIKHELVVTERAISAHSPAWTCRYYVIFENSEVMSRGSLVAEYGEGNTIDEALRDYCLKISNMTIVFNPLSRKGDIRVPRLKHTKPTPNPY